MRYCDNLECWQEIDDSRTSCADHDGSCRQPANKLDLSGLSSAQLHHRAAPGDLSKAIALTHHAISNQGEPIYASMVDHKPGDIPLAQALTQIALSKQGEKHADPEKVPADRAIAEALTLNAIASNPQDKLRVTGRRSSTDEGLTLREKAALLEDAQAEKDRKAAAKVFGGGDAKTAMAAILGEIENQGVISVPHDKVPDDSISLNQIKTMAQINALSEGKGPELTHVENPEARESVALTQARTLKALSSDSAKSNLTHTETHGGDVPLAHAKTLYELDHMKEPHLKHEEHKLNDPLLAHEKTLYAISHHREQSVPLEKAPVDKALLEAFTMNALASEGPKSHLKPVAHPEEGLNKDDLVALQAAAAQEKAEGEAEAPVIHMPKEDSDV